MMCQIQKHEIVFNINQIHETIDIHRVTTDGTTLAFRNDAPV